jgi:hypothetical protein
VQKTGPGAYGIDGCAAGFQPDEESSILSTRSKQKKNMIELNLAAKSKDGYEHKTYGIGIWVVYDDVIEYEHQLHMQKMMALMAEHQKKQTSFLTKTMMNTKFNV